MKIYGLNPYRNILSFSRKIEEHRSWGAHVDPVTKDVSFKLFSFPDNKDVKVKIEDKNNPKNFKTYEMISVYDDGVFETLDTITKKDVKEGDRYSFIITKADGTKEEVKDPYAMRQGNQTKDNFLNNSIIYDHSRYNWKNEAIWKKSPERIVRNPSPGQKSLREASIYELQIDTFTEDGTYESAKEKLEKIKKLGFNTIEIMPNENTFSFNWGYDGVDKFAPQEHRGGPDKLKELIDYAHGLELNVIMDYVPNHLGPDGAQLKRTGPYIKGQNAFGESFNFEGENSKYVRDYIVNAAINWLDNYKVEGLRLDMTKFMESDFAMKEIAAEVNYHFPDKVLIAEDSREHINVNDAAYYEDYSQFHDKRVTTPLSKKEQCEGEDEETHSSYIDEIDKTVEEFKSQGVNYHNMLKNLGYDSEWDFSFHHSLNNAIYSCSDMEWLLDTVFQSQNNVKYVTSHDEIGNEDGTRPVVKYLVPELNLWQYLSLNKKDTQRVNDYYHLRKKNDPYFAKENAENIVKCQKMQSVCEALARQYASGELDIYKDKPFMEFYKDVLAPLDISASSRLSYRRLATGIKRSIAKVRMAQALTYSIPGPKMVFQGEENIDLTPFRFFRMFENPRKEKYLEVEKGYKSGKAALEASTLKENEYSGDYGIRAEKYEKFMADLNKINRENPALTRGNLLIDKKYTSDCLLGYNIIGLHSRDEESNNEFFVLTNFDDDYNREFAANIKNIPFPEGLWQEVLNTDDLKYGGTGMCTNKGVISGYGIDGDTIKVKMGQTSTILFKRVA